MTATSRSGGDRVANGTDSFPQDGLPSRPGSFTAAENGYWTALLDQIPNELLRRVDVHQLRSLCELMSYRDVIWEKLKLEPLNKTVYSHYLRTVQQICRLSVVFGLGPLDRRRMKIDIPEPDGEDEW